jgi:hypothetical protein
MPKYDHILIVIEENDDASFILGNASAPYFNKVLVPLGALMTDSHAREHPSLPNYLVLFSGSAQGVNPKNIHQGLTGLDPSTQKPVALPADPSALGSGALFNADGSINAFVDPATHHVLVYKNTPIFQFGTDDPLPQTDDGHGSYTRPLTTPNLGAALLRAGKTFAGYSEDLLAITPSHPQPDPLAVKNVDLDHGIDYVRKHNPWSNWVRADPTAQNHGLPPSVNRDFSAFPTMASRTSPDFSTLPTIAFVIPNQFHDEHGNKIVAQHSEESFKAMDDFLVRHIEPYRRWAASHNSLLIVTWDEDAYTMLKNGKGQLVDPTGKLVPLDSNGMPTRAYFPNHIVTVLAGAHVRAGSYDQRIDHCNVLRTIEVAAGLEPLASDGSTCDAHADPISAPFEAR